MSLILAFRNSLNNARGRPAAAGGGGGGGGGDPLPGYATWRISMTKTQREASFNTISLAEVELLDADNNVIDVSEATISGSGSYGGSETEAAAFDGDPATNWAASRSTNDGSEEAYLQVTFPENVEVKGYTLKARRGDDQAWAAPIQHSLQYLDPETEEFVNLDGVVYEDDYMWWTEATDTCKKSYWPGGRRWRLRMTNSQHGSRFGLGELQFRSVANVDEEYGPGKNDPQCFQNCSWGNENSGDQSVGYAFDGNTATHWGGTTANRMTDSGVAGAWIGRSYPTKKDVAQILLRARATDLTHGPTAFRLEYCDDGSTWVEVLNTTTTNWTNTNPRTFGVSY